MCCWGLLAAFVLSGVGAVAMRGVASLLGIDAWTLVGLTPRADRSRPARSLAMRGAPIWVTTHLAEGVRGWRAFGVRATAPIAIVLVPLVSCVLLAVACGRDVPAESPFVVGTVVFASPAEDAGLEAGDTILEIDGQPITDMESIRAALAHRSGIHTEIVFERAGARRTSIVVPRSSEDHVVMGITSGTRRESIGWLMAMRGTLAVAAASWSWIARPTQSGLVGPVGLVRAAGHAPDALHRALYLSISAWTFAPLVALLAAIGQVRSARRS